VGARAEAWDRQVRAVRAWAEHGRLAWMLGEGVAGALELLAWGDQAARSACRSRGRSFSARVPEGRAARGRRPAEPPARNLARMGEIRHQPRRASRHRVLAAEAPAAAGGVGRGLGGRHAARQYPLVTAAYCPASDAVQRTVRALPHRPEQLGSADGAQLERGLLR